MENYRSNPRCECARCRMAGIMGPAVLITIGAIFLLDNLGALGFHNTWPVLLIVIGIVKVLQYTAPVENHVPRGYAPMTPPPPAPNAGELPPSAQPPATSGGEEGQNV